MFTLPKASAFAILVAAIAIAPHRVRADEPTFDVVRPLLMSYCVSCHGGSKPKGELDLANLAPDFAKNEAIWKDVYERLSEGSMPPKDKSQPTLAEQEKILNWVASSLAVHQRAQASTAGRTRHRR